MFLSISLPVFSSSLLLIISFSALFIFLFFAVSVSFFLPFVFTLFLSLFLTFLFFSRPVRLSFSPAADVWRDEVALPPAKSTYKQAWSERGRWAGGGGEMNSNYRGQTNDANPMAASWVRLVVYYSRAFHEKEFYIVLLYMRPLVDDLFLWQILTFFALPIVCSLILPGWLAHYGEYTRNFGDRSRRRGGMAGQKGDGVWKDVLYPQLVTDFLQITVFIL